MRLALGAGLGFGTRVAAVAAPEPTIYERIIAVAPTKIVGLWTADDVVLSGGKIAQWTNQVTGLHLGQSGAGAQAVLGTPVNGKQVAVFAGAAAYYTCVTPAGGAANVDLSAADRVSVFLGGFKQTNAVAAQIVFELAANYNSANAIVAYCNDPANHSQTIVLHDLTNAIYCGGYNTLADSTVRRAQSYSYILSGTNVATQLQLRVNGAALALTQTVGNSNCITPYDAAPLYVGGRAASSVFMHAELGMLVLAADLTVAEEAQIDALIGTYYGT